MWVIAANTVIIRSDKSNNLKKVSEYTHWIKIC